MLFLGIPRNGGFTHGDEISSDRTTSDRATSSIIITCSQNKRRIRWQKKAQAKISFQIVNDTKSGVQMCCSRFLRELSKSMNNLSEFRMSETKIDELVDQPFISAQHGKETSRSFGLHVIRRRINQLQRCFSKYTFANTGTYLSNYGPLQYPKNILEVQDLSF